MCHLLLDLLPIPLCGLFGFVVTVGVVGAVFDDVGEVLLADPVVGEVVGVEVALVAFEACAVGVDVLQLARDGAGLPGLDVGDGGVNGYAAGVGLRRGGKQDDPAAGRCRRRPLRW